MFWSYIEISKCQICNEKCDNNSLGAVELPSSPISIYLLLIITDNQVKRRRKKLGFWGARTDLVEAAFRGEDGNVAVVPRGRAAAHVAGRRKISKEEEVWCRRPLEGAFVCATRLGSREQLTSARLILFRKKNPVWVRPKQKIEWASNGLARPSEPCPNHASCCGRAG